MEAKERPGIVPRKHEEDGQDEFLATERFEVLKKSARLSIIGQALTTTLPNCNSLHIPLQNASLEVVNVLVTLYFPSSYIPTILPGVASTMTQVALGTASNKAWQRGEAVRGALSVFQAITVLAVGDEVCVKEGAVRKAGTLEDMVSLAASDETEDSKPAGPTPKESYATPRTPQWLRGTASQLHIALNTTIPTLLGHPSHIALQALSSFCSAVLADTSLTLPQSQPLLLNALLSLSLHPLPSVSEPTRQSLIALLTPPSSCRHTLLQIILVTARDSLAALPRIIPSHSDTKLQHTVNLILAICDLTSTSSNKALLSLSRGVGKLLGPSGGIEKWGWSLLSVLEFVAPSVSITPASTAGAILDGSNTTSGFPELQWKHVASREVQQALERLFRALGQASGDDGLFSVEWFVNLAKAERGQREVSALWCACRILEGVGSVKLGELGDSKQCSKRLDKISRWVAKTVSEFWDEEESPTGDLRKEPPTEHDEGRLVEHVKGITPLYTLLDFRPLSYPAASTDQQPRLHRILSLHALTLTAQILTSRYPNLLLNTLYPLLSSVVSTDSLLSSTALAALNHTSYASGYASSSNLLLSNFDYALSSVSRRLTRQRLDVQATKVLVVLVRLVGKEVVDRAGDVVEECFERLEDFHGYQIVVEGLVEVLGEVVKVVETDTAIHNGLSRPRRSTYQRPEDRLAAFAVWFKDRSNVPETGESDFGPAPRRDWTKAQDPMDEEQEAAKEHEEMQKLQAESEAPQTPTQKLTEQIVARSIYFLTHSSPLIRARILSLIASSVSTLSSIPSSILQTVHRAWPFVINRLSDSEPFVVAEAAQLVESLVRHVGDFMARRMWDDIWPIFRRMLRKLEEGDAQSALARRGRGAIGTESAYSVSHRLYGSMLRTLTAAVAGTDLKDEIGWEIAVMMRRFLSVHAHQELQVWAVELFRSLAQQNSDMVWLVLWSTAGSDFDGKEATQSELLNYLKEEAWEIVTNVYLVFDNV